MEHFDEHLDRFFEMRVVGHILPEYVGPFTEPSGVTLRLFRAYYVDTGMFELLGKGYEIQPLATEVGMICEQLLRMDRLGGRLRRQDV